MSEDDKEKKKRGIKEDIPTPKITFHKTFPYTMLYNPQYIKSTQVPRKPILISRNSEQVTFKLPPFKPKLLDMIAID